MPTKTFKKILNRNIVQATPLDFVTTIDFDVYGTFDFSLDGGNTFTTSSGQPFNISGVPSGDILVKAAAGNVTRISFAQKDFFQSITITEITGSITSAWRMFEELYSLTSLDVRNLNTSNVTTMFAMFANCPLLTILDVSKFDTSNVNDMKGMFAISDSITSLDVSNFDTSNVTTMQSMFSSCRALTSLDVSNFNTSNVTDMFALFDKCSGLTSLDLSSFDATNLGAAGVGLMFQGCSSLTNLDLTGLNFTTGVERDKNFWQKMFSTCTNLICITNIDTTTLYTGVGEEDIVDMFLNTPALVNPTPSEQTAIVTASTGGLNYVNASACP